MKTYRLLDLCCKAGGASMGYFRAGFTQIVGVDLEPQKRYPFDFVQGDAIEYVEKHGAEFDAIHASPPCQKYTGAARQWRSAGKEYPDLIAPTRKALRAIGNPYIIENVPGAPLLNPVVLNGGMFGLLVHRVRLFECSFPVPFVLLPQLPRPVKMGRPVRDGDVIQPVGNFSGAAYARQQMGIEWMTGRELAQAIPPSYTEWLGKIMLRAIQEETRG